jgi:hypothetical protein
MVNRIDGALTGVGVEDPDGASVTTLGRSSTGRTLFVLGAGVRHAKVVTAPSVPVAHPARTQAAAVAAVAAVTAALDRRLIVDRRDIPGRRQRGIALAFQMQPTRL